MNILIAASMLLISSVGALAADVTAPVREIIEATASNWTEEAFGNEQEVFTEDRLERIFSAEFAMMYREASKNPAYDLPEGETTGFPFDYDPIARGQDGCPFQNIRIEDDGDGQVTALFNNRECMGDDSANRQDTVLIFHVLDENGRAVIDDIYPVENGQSGQSIKDELKAIAGQ
ncbi:hypothetical protein PDO_1709 [Rhizobium sp. PDO1-076]|mgnify:CR=1 FL=1|uniref:hypothetical protein n=1 Tax=Rhizobium sp. PDO1-076 TaxID=1125979 RepID=UPI00024E2773|nr:hypothetical protein [Rhizobium sp. PDO1-076]EHS51808.1 hypothetical protein PDO_1709 [Rhizobium sp. PDO1-076]